MSTTRINADQLVAHCSGDQESANLRLESFCDRALQLIDLIEISIGNQSWQEVSELANRFHGTLQSISAKSVAELAQTLECQSRQQQCPVFDDLQKETTILVAEIQAYLENTDA